MGLLSILLSPLHAWREEKPVLKFLLKMRSRREKRRGRGGAPALSTAFGDTEQARPSQGDT